MADIKRDKYAPQNRGRGSQENPAIRPFLNTTMVTLEECGKYFPEKFVKFKLIDFLKTRVGEE